MVNVPWTSTHQLRDVESLNFAANCRRTGLAEEAWTPCAVRRGTTPVRRCRGTTGPTAAFTTGTPWIMLNPDYPQINVEKARRDPDSVFHFYRRLVAMRKKT